MPPRRLPVLLAGLFALAAPAAALGQDHARHDHQAHQPPEPDPGEHAAHTPHMAPGADHAGHGGMTSPLGPWPLSRDASGTSWQPDLSEHGGLHATRGDWTLMGHAVFNLVHDWQNGPRGDDKTFVSGMVMGAARRDFADGGVLNLRAMLSPEPWMGEEGFPLLLAAGETADGVNPLIDRQRSEE